MKIAVCISGGVRYPHIGIKSIQNIMPNDDIKIFIHTWKVKNFDEFLNTVFGYQYKELDKTIEQCPNIIDLFDYEKILIENYDTKKSDFELIYNRLPPEALINRKWYDQNTNMCGTVYPRKDVGPLSMHYSIFKANELKKQYEVENNMLFDCVIRMRFDSDFGDEILDVSQMTDALYIPDGEDWCGGINDQFALGSSFLMDIYSNLYNNLLKLDDCPFQPENMLNKYIKATNVPLKRFNFFVGINNGIDFRKVLFG